LKRGRNVPARDFKTTRRMFMTRVLLLPFIVLMLVCGTIVYHFAVSLGNQVEGELIRTAEEHRRLIDQFLGERKDDLRFAAATNTFRELSNESNLQKLLKNLQSGSRAFFDLGVFDRAGNHVAYTGPYELAGKNYAGEEWFKKVQKKGVYISDVFLGFRNIPHFVIAVREGDGTREWYLRATIDTLFFNQLVENVRIGKTGEAYLVNEEGKFQTRRRSGGDLMELDNDSHLYEFEPGRTVSFSAEDRSGTHHLYAVSKLEHTGWLLVVRQEFIDAYTPLAKAVISAIGLIVGGGAVVMLIAFFLATSLANRLTMADMEKRQMKTQLIMAGRLAEVGEMSAGVAHEINNPLQTMMSEHAMINDLIADLKEIPEENVRTIEMIKDSVNQIGLQINRCRHITQGLLKFARESETTIQKVNLPSLIEESVDMVEHKAQLENISILREIESDIPELDSDPAQLQQVLVNLMNNAIDALRGKNDGLIRITALQNNGEVTISVADNGCGIAPENLEKIFLPFFTTKPVGQGTGLGLSTCYGIIERLGGKITVESELNNGTVFTIKLPLSQSVELERVG